MLRYAILFSALLATPLVSAATEIEPLANIREAVASFLRTHATHGDGTTHIEVGGLDQRLRLPRCEGPLTGFFPPGTSQRGQVTVGVRCTGSKPWTVYVTGKVKHLRNVVVLARTMPRASRLTPTDLRLEERDTSALLEGYLTDVASAVGMHLARSVVAGQPLNEALLSRPRLVQRGQRVTVVARSGGIEVRSEGKALTDGAAGQLIQVRNHRSKRVVEGVVTDSGLVTVRM